VRKSGVAGIALLAWLSVAAPNAAASPPARFQPGACAFKDVPADWAARNRVDCGWLHVPESRGKPDSRTLKLWVAIARADAADKREDPILYIHGGPGFATVDYFFPSFTQSKTWPAFRKTRDIVFFDQRGTGRSDPAFCPELSKSLQEVQQAAPPAREALDRSKAAFAACRPKMLAQGFDFSAYNSTATAGDAEDLRRALGVAQWNVYSISYGTLVGLEYLRQHPGSVRAAILDSLFPPNSPHGAELITSAALGYQALQRACSLDADCRGRFPDILDTLQQAVERLDANPLPRTAGGRITGTTLRDAMWSMLVRTKTAPWVPLALDRAAAGDEDVIRKLDALFGGTGGFGDYSHGQAMAVNCFEVIGGSTTESMRDAMLRYPYLAARDAIASEFDELCAAWQTQRAPPEFHAPVRSNVPVLLYGGEFDPATPYDDAVLASKNLPNSTLVHVPGASHAAFALDDCTRGIARAFLDAPAHRPDLGCLAQRKPTVFPAEGLIEFLKSMEG
jgi:pimeloyl-ACP methyl ester carboxylesterase